MQLYEWKFNKTSYLTCNLLNCDTSIFTIYDVYIDIFVYIKKNLHLSIIHFITDKILCEENILFFGNINTQLNFLM